MIQAIETGEAPAPVAPYSQGIAAGGFLFISGQLGIDPKTGHLIADDLERQTIQALDNITAILHKAGANWGRVVKIEIYLANSWDAAVVNALYGERVQGVVQPARLMIAVARLPQKARIEIVCTAFLGLDPSNQQGAQDKSTAHCNERDA